MKVLQINVAVNKGSTGKIVEQIGEVLINKGSKSYIAYSRTGLPSKSKTIKIGNRYDVYNHVLQSRLFDNHGFVSKNSTIDLVKKIDIIGPDIIHLHNIHGYYIHIKELFNYLNKKNIPIVWTFHDCWPFTGHCSYFDRVDCEKWKTVCFSCPMKKYYPKSWFIDNSRNNFENKKKLFTTHVNITIVTPSLWLKELVKQSYFNNFPIKVIHNGVDLNIFKPIPKIKDDYSKISKKIVLGVASIWDARKGLDDFIKLNELLDDEFQIVLVGLSKNQIHKLPSNIIGFERTENINELVKLYSKAIVYLNLTYSDNFPTTNIEALACGTPVISYDTGGSPEAINQDTGIVIKKSDIRGVVEAIHTIERDENRFGKKLCRERALEMFNKNDRFLEYYNLYLKILK